MGTKKKGYIIILLVFVNVICFSSLWRILLNPFVDSSNHEKRKMASRPHFSLEGYTSFSEEFTAFFNDNIPFRNELISLNNEIDYLIFKKSPVADVIIGKDHWLFYGVKDHGDPIADYEGSNLYSKKELEELAANCIRQRDFLSRLGKEFVIFIAPNKERMYYEYMPPQYGAPAANYKVLQIYQYLKEKTDLRIIYPYNELKEARGKVKENLWYKTDTHWNYIGAYIGASALLKELGIAMPAVDSEEIRISSSGKIQGDLGGMLNLSDRINYLDDEYVVEGYDKHNVEEVKADFYGAYIYHAENADPRKLYVIRDSFSYHMGPFIGSQFNDSYLRHYKKNKYKHFVKQDPDIVVYEVVEREVDRLKTFSIK